VSYADVSRRPGLKLGNTETLGNIWKPKLLKLGNTRKPSETLRNTRKRSETDQKLPKSPSQPAVVSTEWGEFFREDETIFSHGLTRHIHSQRERQVKPGLYT
jgi:hypothetical protein